MYKDWDTSIMWRTFFLNKQRSTIALAFPILLNFVYIVKCCTIRKVLKTVIRFWIWYSLIHYWYLKLSHIIPSSQGGELMIMQISLVESFIHCKIKITPILLKCTEWPRVLRYSTSRTQVSLFKIWDKFNITSRGIYSKFSIDKTCILLLFNLRKPPMSI